jgi:hypothetical protein
MEAVDLLRAHLASISPGRIDDTRRLEELVAESWQAFAGSESGGMEPYKVQGRMESVSWAPPRLTFEIERHGATVLGSTMAERQEWELDIDTLEASCSVVGRRLVRKRQQPPDVRWIAEKIFRCISDRQDHEALGWEADRSVVSVKISRIIPSEIRSEADRRAATTAFLARSRNSAQRRWLDCHRSRPVSTTLTRG